jgi:succinate dehydrogenase / fumarate reductase flavoprotein subunit
VFDGAINYVNSLYKDLNYNNDDVTRAIKNATDILNRQDGNNPYLVHEELQDIMHNYVGIVRTGEELKIGVKKLNKIKSKIDLVFAHASAQYNPGWNEALDLKNLIITAEAVAQAALLREESRGAHTRLDFEGEKEEGLDYNIVIKKMKQEMRIEKIKRQSPPEA